MFQRPLDPLEIRILGSLLEKQQTTPEYYPLTLSALTAASNQKTNREPVMEVEEAEISRALARLQEMKLVWEVRGGRAVRWDHNLEKALAITAPQKALLTVLLLRGAQTPGELRARTDRMYEFSSTEEVESELRAMSLVEPPLVAGLARRPGQKENRWTHLLGGEPVEATAPQVDRELPELGETVESRVRRLEERLAAAEDEIANLKQSLGVS